MIIADELRRRFEPVQPWDFYHEIFGDGNLDEADAFTKGKYTAIAIEITNEIGSRSGKKLVRRHTITDDLDGIDELIHCDNFCIMAPVSYIGKNRKSVNARHLYALCVELDDLLVSVDELGVLQSGLWNLVHQWDGEGGADYLPRPTFCVSSGSGIHLYYVFEKPLVLYPNVRDGLTKYKRELTRRIWNRYTTFSYEEKHIQFESVFQPFRMPGTITKHGERAEAFRTGEKVSVDYMNKFIPASYQKKGAFIPEAYKGKITLREAQEKWPEWYQRRIVEGDKTKKKWDIAGKVRGDNPYALYDWWYNKIYENARVGKRYYCLFCLVVYAVKCGVSEERLEQDCYSLLKRFDSFADDPTKYATDRKNKKKPEENRFTAEDVECALSAYDESLYTFPINSIIYKTGIPIEKNKRNGRKRKDHVKLMNYIRDELNHTEWRNKDGRPKGSGTAQQQVLEWRESNPDGTKYRCIKETGLSKPTVYKWWDTELTELEMFEAAPAAARRSMDDLSDYEDDMIAPYPWTSMPKS